MHDCGRKDEHDQLECAHKFIDRLVGLLIYALALNVAQLLGAVVLLIW